MIRATIENEIYNYTLEVYVWTHSSDMDKVIAELNEIKDIEIPYNSMEVDWLYMHSEVTWKWYLILESFDISIMIHEIIHLVFRLSELRWLPLHINSDETSAYLAWFYAKRILELKSSNT